MTLSGSLPKGLEPDYYQRLIANAKAYRCQTVLDCSGAPLRAVLEGKDKPVVIKPNLEELEALLGRAIAPDTTALKEALNQDRKSTRLNSSHANISYAVFCLKKKQ